MSNGAVFFRKLQPGKRFFRRVRLTFWVCVLLLVLCLVGLPEIPLKALVGATAASLAKAHGVRVDFERVAWQWYRGLVAKGIKVHCTGYSGTLSASIAEATLNPRWLRLLTTRKLEFESIQILRGEVSLLGSEQPEFPRGIEFTNISGRVQFKSTNVLEILDFQCFLSGLQLDVQGALTNFPCAIQWFASRNAAEEKRRDWQITLSNFVKAFGQLRFDKPPELHLRIAGDLDKPGNLTANLRSRVPFAGGSWGEANDCQIEIDLVADSFTELSARSGLTFRGRKLETPFLEFEDFELHALLAERPESTSARDVEWQLKASVAKTARVRLLAPAVRGTTRMDRENVLHTNLEMTSCGAETDWVSAMTNVVRAMLVHSVTNFVPCKLVVESEARGVESKYGQAESISLRMETSSVVQAQASSATNQSALARYISSNRIRLDLAAAGVESTRAPVRGVKLSATWFHPELQVDQIEAELPGGILVLRPASLDLRERKLVAEFCSTFDVHSLGHLLGDKAAAWLARFQWHEPPEIRGQASLIIPSSLSSKRDLWGELCKACLCEARIVGRNASYQGVPVDSASLKVCLSNEVLRITDFLVVRPEGCAELEYTLKIPTRQFSWKVRGSLNPKEIAPAISSAAPALLSRFEFDEPPYVAGHVGGRWKPSETIECMLDIGVTNFTFQGERIQRLNAHLLASNRVVVASNMVIEIGDEWIKAPLVCVDLDVPQVGMTNVECRVEPLRVARAIGSQVVEALQPYKFQVPPLARVSGYIAFPEHRTEPDMLFDVAGGPFEFWRIKASEVSGLVHWRREFLSVTNLTASVCEGRLTGHVLAEFRGTNNTEIRFAGQLVNADLAMLTRDIFQYGGRVEGLVTANLAVLGGEADDVKTWSGYGNVEMRDGLLWDIPIFGILSPVLNAVVPGLGNSKARSASATFTLNRGTLQTEDMIVDAGPAKLRYRGRSDLEGRVDARIEAEILATTPLVGPFISFVLTPVSKIFIFQVNGTLAKPQLEPVYVPKFLMLLLRPFQTLRNVLPGGGNQTP